MLPKKSRIKRALYGELLSGSRFIHSPHFILRQKLITSGECAVGVSVSKKVSKSAVTRNTIRRRVYALVSKYLFKYPNYLLLFVAKKGAENIKGKGLETEIEQLFSELR